MAPKLFLDLPPEIRLQIYKYSLSPTGYLKTASEYVQLNVPNGCKSYYEKCKFVAGIPYDRQDIEWGLPLLQTCKKIYNEAKPIIYESNMIDIELNSSNPVLGGWRRDDIQHIWFRISGYQSSNKRAIQYIEDLATWKENGSMFRSLRL